MNIYLPIKEATLTDMLQVQVDVILPVRNLLFGVAFFVHVAQWDWENQEDPQKIKHKYLISIIKSLQLSVTVLAFAKQLESDETIPNNQIASLTKQEFKDQCCADTISNILKENPLYFNKNMIRKSSKTQTAKSKVISLIKLLKDDDPRISLLLSDVAEPIHIVRWNNQNQKSRES